MRPTSRATARVTGPVLLLIAALLLPAAALLAACQVDSYCLDCKRIDGGNGDGDGSMDDGSNADAIDSGGGPPDACAISGAEVCDGLDNDCNGMIDDNPTDIGAACQVGANPPCTAGVFECVGGDLVCGGGAITPVAETCNGIDDDCDGTPDDGDPGGGSLCGMAEGDCIQGFEHCVSGSVQCVGATGPTAETCDNRDNDCDGMIDEGNPGGGASCGSGMGICTPGTIMCAGGVLRCEGASPPTLEVCDMMDNDCDGMTDEDFNLQTDKNNCGMCGRKCVADMAVTKCQGGNCAIAFCLTDYWDKNGSFADGCELHCVFQGNEVCNGEDDDCDGQIDEGVVAPNSCASLGECNGTVATCMGASGFVCNYPATVSKDAMGNIVPESNCDNKDNDCDGDTDEAFPLKNTACTDSGVGVCQGSGSFGCNAMQNGLTCNITTPGQPSTAEVCDGKDNNCNGMVDDNAKDNWVAITGVGITGTKFIFQYEASRPDASGTSQGILANRACANPNVLPWTNVTYPQAEAACAAAGGRLCSETEWQRACNSPAMTACTWGMTSCTAYGASTCNGNDFDSDAAAPGDQDALLKTKTLANCYADWGSVATRIFDMSGNAKEWAQTAMGDPANTRRLRGGSFNNTANGISCNFRFAVADATFQFQNVGFRCCRDTPPP